MKKINFEINNLLNTKDIVLDSLDIQNIVNYALKNEIVKVSVYEKGFSCGNERSFAIDTNNNISIEFDDNQEIKVVVTLDNTRDKTTIEDKKPECAFCGGAGYITVAGNHDINCKECLR